MGWPLPELVPSLRLLNLGLVLLAKVVELKEDL